ncbi:MAG: hypothetical protein U0234_07510 [Sandaracinus sp.]
MGKNKFVAIDEVASDHKIASVHVAGVPDRQLADIMRGVADAAAARGVDLRVGEVADVAIAIGGEGRGPGRRDGIGVVGEGGLGSGGLLGAALSALGDTRGWVAGDPNDPSSQQFPTGDPVRRTALTEVVYPDSGDPAVHGSSDHSGANTGGQRYAEMRQQLHEAREEHDRAVAAWNAQFAHLSQIGFPLEQLMERRQEIENDYVDSVMQIRGRPLFDRGAADLPTGMGHSGPEDPGDDFAGPTDALARWLAWAFTPAYLREQRARRHRRGASFGPGGFQTNDWLPPDSDARGGAAADVRPSLVDAPARGADASRVLRKSSPSVRTDTLRGSTA